MSDFADADFYTDLSLVDDPQPFYEYLRNQGPVTRLPGRNVVAVTGYEEALEVYRKVDDFSSINAVTGPLPELPFTPRGDDIAEQIAENRPQIPFSLEIATLDAPDHQPMRSLLMPLFTPSKLRDKQAGFHAIADKLIDEFIGAGRVEFITGYANPMATLVITELLGVPEADRPQFRKYFEGTVALIGASDEQLGNNPLIEMGIKIATYIAERREVPQGDVLTELARATFPGGATPTIEEATRAACFVFGAGQDTTQKLLGTTMRMIAQFPDLQQRLRDQPERIPDFVEECLRFEGSIKSSHRLCKRTTTIGGVEIPAGTTVLIANLAVDRDGRRFPNPEVFDIDRPKIKEHLAFGRGAHTCAGAPLARAEAKLTVERLLSRLDDIRLDQDKHGKPGAETFRYEPSYVLRGLSELHVTFTPRG